MRTPMAARRSLSALALVAMLLLGACGEVSSTALPRPAPQLAGTDMEGRSRSLEEFAGDVVVVTAWASWCPPCRDEFPVLASAQEELGPEGLQVVGLNVRDHPPAAAQFVDELDVPFPSVVDTDGTLAVEWGVRSLPETFLLDRQGRIVDHRFGAVTQEWVETTLLPEVQG